jgi:hypothetical protein
MTTTPRFLLGTPDTTLFLPLASRVCEVVHCHGDRAEVESTGRGLGGTTARPNPEAPASGLG